MKINRWLAAAMSAVMMTGTLQMPVRAEEVMEYYPSDVQEQSGETQTQAPAPAAISGTVSIKGLPAVGILLTADWSTLKPEGITEDKLTFQWNRVNSDGTMTQVGSAKTYTPVQADLDSVLSLTVSGIGEKGLAGTATVRTLPVAATEQEAKERKEAAENPQSTQQTEESQSGDTEQAEEALPGSGEQTEEFLPKTEDTEFIEEGSMTVFTPDDTQASGLQETESESWSTMSEMGMLPEGMEDAHEEVYVFNTGDTDTTAEAPDETVSEELPVFSAEIRTAGEDGKVDFGQISGDMETVGEQYVTITNTGNAELNFEGIAPEFFMVQDIHETLEPGQSVDLWVIPRLSEDEEVEPGIHSEVITYRSLEGAEVSYEAVVEIMPEAAAETVEPVSEPEPAPSETPVPTTAPEPTPTDVPEPTPTTVPEPTPTDVPEPTPTTVPEPTPTDVPEPTPTDVPSVSVSKPAVSFGSAEAGYTVDSLPKAETIYVKNEGSSAVSVKTGTSSYFTVSGLEAVLEPGQEATFTIQPAPGLPAGAYSDSIPVYAAEGVSPAAHVTADFTVEEQKIPAITVAPASAVFGNKEAGYAEVPQPVTVTVVNTGNTTIHLQQPVSTNFVIGPLSSVVLAPKETASFTVVPKAALPEGQYSETITVPNAENAQGSLTATFSVSSVSVKLTGIQNPADITGVASGAEKSAAGLLLPADVVIKTTNGDMKANVMWDVASAAYDPASRDPQTFKVSGTVTLPGGIENPDNIPLAAAVNVSVNGRTPIIPDPSRNWISGITSDGIYTTETKISFTAIGAGMDNTNPKSGDVRYVPRTWYIVDGEARSWSSEPYSATFRIGRNGNYTLTVNYMQQSFDGVKWVDSNVTDTKKVSFIVGTGQIKGTPAAKAVKGVQTGDDNPVLPLVIALTAAAAAVIILLIILMRRRKR